MYYNYLFIKKKDMKGATAIFTTLLMFISSVVLIPHNVSAVSNQRSIYFQNSSWTNQAKVKLNINYSGGLNVGNNFSISFWIKPLAHPNASRATPFSWSTANCSTAANNFTQGAVIVDRDVYGAGDYGDYGIAIMQDGRISFGVNDTSDRASVCSNVVSVGEWTYITAVRNGSNILIYQNGFLVSSSAIGTSANVSYRSGRSTSYPNSDPYLVIGSEKHGVGFDFYGLIDDLVVYNYALTTVTKPSSPVQPAAGIVAIYNFDLSANQSYCSSSCINGVSEGDVIYVEDSPYAHGSTETEVYRFYNTRTGTHFYTSNKHEKNDIIKKLPQYKYEGAAYNALVPISPYARPLHRFYNTRTGTHFFTVNENEKNEVIQKFPQFKYEGANFNVADGYQLGLKHVHRFYNTKTGTHFYTASDHEKNEVIQKLPQFKYEGIGFYVL